MSSTENEQSRFGDKAADASSLETGSVAWRNGVQPVIVVGVNEAGDDDPGAGNASVQVAALDVETVHVDELATEYVDPSEQNAMGGPGTTAAAIPAPGAQSVAVVTPQPPADDPARQTTPTGEAASGGTAVVEAAAAQSRDDSQDARIAELDAREADLARREADLEAQRSTAPETPTEPAPPAV